MNIRISLILLIFSIQTLLVELRPTKSLDQPAGDLEWEALLLIHDSSRPKFGKITPKSIFTVRPHSTIMPPCAEGYQSDAMGRCVTKIDQNAHYEFLVQKLIHNSQNSFDPSDYPDDVEDEDVDTPTTGPFQINIPIEKNMESGDISGNDDTGNITVVVAPVNDLSMNLTSINDTLNIISLTKELLKNLTTEVRVKPLERNETVLSLLDDLIQNDQPIPAIERETQPVDDISKIHHISNESKFVENKLDNKSVVNKSENKTDSFNLNDPETIIILFHALPNSTSNRTVVNQDEVISTTENISTTTDINSTTELEDIKTTTEDLQTSDDYESDTEEISSTSEISTIDEFDLNRNTFPHNGDFKTKFFHLRWNNTSNLTSPEETSIEDRQPEKDIVKINFAAPTLSSLIPPAIFENQQLVQTQPEYNHRSRDRNIFWYNPVYSSPQTLETTSERINSKYYSTNSHVNPYRRRFRKTLQDTDRLFNTRRWSNR